LCFPAPVFCCHPERGAFCRRGTCCSLGFFLRRSLGLSFFFFLLLYVVIPNRVVCGRLEGPAVRFCVCPLLSFIVIPNEAASCRRATCCSPGSAASTSDQITISFNPPADLRGLAPAHTKLFCPLNLYYQVRYTSLHTRPVAIFPLLHLASVGAQEKVPWKDAWARERFAKSSSAPIERTGE
jgi:hypothetical protein